MLSEGSYGAGRRHARSTNRACLHYEFSTNGLHFEHQMRLPVVYRGVRLDAGYRIDFLVNVPHLRHGIKRVVNEYSLPKVKDLPSASPASSRGGELGRRGRREREQG